MIAGVFVMYRKFLTIISFWNLILGILGLLIFLLISNNNASSIMHFSQFFCALFYIGNAIILNFFILALLGARWGRLMGFCQEKNVSEFSVNHSKCDSNNGQGIFFAISIAFLIILGISIYVISQKIKHHEENELTSYKTFMCHWAR